MSVLTPASFALLIEEMVQTKNCTYLEAIIEYCDDNMLDPEEVASLVKGPLKDKLRVNFQQAEYLPPTAGLDV